MFKDWKLGSKLITASVVSFLLSIPLCGAGFTLETAGTSLQQFEFGAGMVLLVGAFVLLVAAIIAWLSGGKSR